MPELPEVQTVINYLSSKILKKEIEDIKISNNKFLKNINEDFLKNIVINSRIIKIDRKGKYILFHLDNDYTIVSHLRMEGKYRFEEKEQEFKKHDYIIFYFKNNSRLIYNDSRQFGTIHLTKTSELNNLKELKKLALDPLDEKFNIEHFFQKIKNKNITIKTLLLDQTIISGIGNIYANEILFDVKVNPWIKGKEIDFETSKKIIDSAKKILKIAIKNNGTTIHSYEFGSSKGSFQNFLKVQSREKLKCFQCNEIIKREKDHGRSSFWCPNCQKII